MVGTKRVRLSVTSVRFESPQSELKAKRDENFDRRGERRHREGAGSLRANQHEIFALTRPPGFARLKQIGAEPVIAGALDAVAVKAALERPWSVAQASSRPRSFARSQSKPGRCAAATRANR
jgi:hypothetical protein